MKTFGLRRTTRQPFLALPGLLTILLMSGCVMPTVGPPGGMGGGGPGFPGGGDAEEVCFCDVSQIPVCCDECPQAPACQPGQR